MSNRFGNTAIAEKSHDRMDTLLIIIVKTAFGLAIHCQSKNDSNSLPKLQLNALAGLSIIILVFSRKNSPL
jgi:hypothetical protein